MKYILISCFLCVINCFGLTMYYIQDIFPKNNINDIVIIKKDIEFISDKIYLEKVVENYINLEKEGLCNNINDFFKNKTLTCSYDNIKHKIFVEDVGLENISSEIDEEIYFSYKILSDRKVRILKKEIINNHNFLLIEIKK